ncbi:MAG: hypothetical protein ACRDUW_10870 [Pseudonocardiaceae bacterium]
MRLDDFDECGGAHEHRADAPPCRNVAMMALILGAVADMSNRAQEATLTLLSEWCPQVPAHMLCPLLDVLWRRGDLQAPGASQGGRDAPIRLTGQGWLTLAGLPRTWPDRLGWEQLLPVTFGMTGSVSTEWSEQ